MSALVVLVSLLGLTWVAGILSAVEVKDSRNAIDGLRTQYLADAGIERGLNFVAQAIKNTSFHDPLHGITDLFHGASTVTPFIGEAVMNGNARVGSYSVSLTSIQQSDTSVTIAIDATGYLPDAPSALPAGRPVTSWHAIRRTVRYSLAPSQVFDYAYFLNNWGWFYGNTILCYGNARSNGQFDVAGYSPTVAGQPLYNSVSWNGTNATLSGYHDDNGDGMSNGGDGGVFSGWDIVNAQHVQGVGGLAANQHDFQTSLPMPNLSDLSRYEASAVAKAGNIKIGGSVMTDAVYGDNAAEKGNLYLNGTLANPIVINGPVVVRGDVIITGYVTGQGSIYAGGNVYCPDSIRYVNAPATSRPPDNSQASTEAWLSSNWNKDFLGLFAKENLVVGDCTNSTWQYYVNSWIGHSMNTSKEDAGLDGMPNTRVGRDGISGTADDDVLDGDGVFTIERYTAQDAALGLIPAGKHVGDGIPGTGEDIDGDGVFDPQAVLSDVVLTRPLDTSNWGGNMPATGIPSYSSIASMSAARLDAVFYTNHSFCWVVLGGEPAKINGALVSRNEDIVYGTPTVEFNYDCRLLGGATGRAGQYLPSSLQAPEFLSWEQLDHDPNRYAVSP